jgi:CheY-like chemotaxis protein
MDDSGETTGAHAETRRIIHELRQPLAAMQMWLDLLVEKLRGHVGEREERYIGKLRAEMARMTALLASSSAATSAAPRTPARATGASPHEDGPSLAGISLLLVEDDAMTAEALQLALEGEGATVLVADSIAAALATLVATRPDGVLSDLQLSDGDGFALVAEIRKRDAAAGRTTPALAVTGFDSAETRNASRAAGFDDLVVKPFAIAELIDRIVRLVAAAR